MPNYGSHDEAEVGFRIEQKQILSIQSPNLMVLPDKAGSFILPTLVLLNFVIV